MFFGESSYGRARGVSRFDSWLFHEVLIRATMVGSKGRPLPE